MSPIKKFVAGVVLETNDGFILFGTSTIFDGKLIIPGGGLKTGETPHEAAVRELIEETGVDIEPYTYTLIADHRTGETKKLIDGEWRVLLLRFFDFHVVLHDRVKDEVHVVAESDFKEPRWIHKHAIDRDAIAPPTIWLLEQLGYL